MTDHKVYGYVCTISSSEIMATNNLSVSHFFKVVQISIFLGKNHSTMKVIFLESLGSCDI